MIASAIGVEGREETLSSLDSPVFVLSQISIIGTTVIPQAEDDLFLYPTPLRLSNLRRVSSIGEHA